jgi:hypothetical protein
LGYNVQLVGPYAGEVIKTCWPLVLAPWKGFEFQWGYNYDDREYMFDVMTPPVPPPPNWMKYHWVCALYWEYDPEEMLFAGVDADAPKPDVILNFACVPHGRPGGLEPRVEAAGYFEVYVLLPYVNQCGQTFCLSMAPYGGLNTPEYGHGALQYDGPVPGNPTLERVVIRTIVQQEYYIGAVLSDALNLYDIPEIDFGPGGGKNPAVVWSDPVTPSPNENNPRFVFLNLAATPPPYGVRELLRARAGIAPASLGKVKALFK